jgi:purine nucleosidase
MRKINMREKIIIDTDIGDDIDDVLAIAFALNSPEIDVVGITTVCKNTCLRARMASGLLRKMGRLDIPVAAGIGKPLINEFDLNEVPWHYIKDVDNEEPSYKGDAVDFIIEKLASSEGDITIVPIGPLTNIAAVLIKAPEVKKKIKRIVLMGGAYYIHDNEWNIVCDPEAARIVFESGVEIVGVGLDVTFKCILPKNEIDRIKNHGTPATDFLYKLIEIWNWPTLYLHDPLAVAVAFDESLVKLDKSIIKVETRGEFTRGTTFNKKLPSDQDIESKTRVCSEVDSERFVKLFIERILGGSV